jgi:hypothetical protein
MNSLAWIGIILWGLLVTGFGIASAGHAGDVAAQDVIFLIGGGLLSCLIGCTGLMGFMGWIPRLRKEQKNIA